MAIDKISAIALDSCKFDEVYSPKQKHSSKARRLPVKLKDWPLILTQRNASSP